MSNLRILKVEYAVTFDDDREYLSDKFKALVKFHGELINKEMGYEGKHDAGCGVIKWRVEDGGT